MLFLKRFYSNQAHKLIQNIPKTNISNLIKNPVVGEVVEIKGWIKSLRKQKENIFIDINDGSSHERLQILIQSKNNTLNLSPGSSLSVIGSVSLSPKGNVEVLAKDVKLYSECNTSDGYPFAPRKMYTQDYVRQYCHLRSKTNKFSSLLRVRSKASHLFHEYFQENHFINVFPPILTANDCEGAGETFKVLPDNTDLLKSMSLSNDMDSIFFDKKTFLTVSGQLHLEAMVNGLGKVYCFGPTFRAENSKSRLHLAEFYMIESEIAFLENLEQLLDFVEDLIKYVSRNLLDNCIEDIQICQDVNKSEINWIDKKFPILTYDEAVNVIKKNFNDFKAEDEIKKEHELFLVKYNGNIPVFIINWPKHNKPFYMKEIDNDKVAAFDLLTPITGELVGGSLRENNIDILKKNMPNNLEWYLETRRFGGVPTGGFGLGFERYLQSILHIENIKDTISFPRWPHNCTM